MLTRREVLLGLAGCSVGCTAGEPARPSSFDACTDLPRATFLGIAPFVNEDPIDFDVPLGAGLDGRLYTNLARLELGAKVVESDRFYIRTRYPDRLDPNAPWRLRIADTDASIADIASRARPLGTHLLECSGNTIAGRFSLLSTARWSGVSLLELLRERSTVGSSDLVLVSGNDEHSQPSARSVPGASWIFRASDLESAGAFLATSMNDAPLPPDHGAPIRLVVPNWYGCACIKWVDTIAIVPESEPATAHMKEFASRTMQSGVPALAREFAPASIDHAAVAVRVERWDEGGRIVHRILGITWGGDRATSALSLRIGDGPPERIALCEPRTTLTTWAWWAHVWRGEIKGVVSVRATIEDPAIRARRLAAGYYSRSFLAG